MSVVTIQVWGDNDSEMGSVVETSKKTEALTLKNEPHLILPDVTPQLQVVIPAKKKRSPRKQLN